MCTYGLIIYLNYFLCELIENMQFCFAIFKLHVGQKCNAKEGLAQYACSVSIFFT